MFTAPVANFEKKKATGGSPSTHTLWRLYMTENSSRYYTVTEFALMAVAGGADLCLGGTATADSTDGSNYPASNAIDGNYGSSSAWVAAGTAPPHWLQVALSSPAHIVEYSISGYLYTFLNTCPPSAFQLQYSDNGGTSWTTVDSRTGVSWPTTETTQTFEIAAYP